MFKSDAIIFPLAIITSLLMHIIALPEVFSTQELLGAISPNKSTHLETPLNNPSKVTLGIDKSSASTLTWIGYEEYELHIATLSTNEQAAMQVVEESPMQSVSAETIQSISTPISEFASQLLDAIAGIEISFPSRALPPVEITEKPSQAQPSQTQPEEIAEDAVPSDRDSIPTSIVKITQQQWKSGKPIAAEGIVLRPRKPSFTANQLVSNAPSDLIATLYIDNSGKPADVERVMSTGSQSIDRSLIASLYRWRASGKQIDTLEDGKTVPITIHLTFTRH